jgi:hypothetical protein
MNGYYGVIFIPSLPVAHLFAHYYLRKNGKSFRYTIIFHYFASSNSLIPMIHQSPNLFLCV